MKNLLLDYVIHVPSSMFSLTTKWQNGSVFSPKVQQLFSIVLEGQQVENFVWGKLMLSNTAFHDHTITEIWNWVVNCEEHHA